MAGNKITGKATNQRKYITLHGMFGSFDLPQKSVKVKYFSTMASSSERDSDSYALLKELKPMRERVKASEIKDLASLLQRNLDDYRVAYELVPYLLQSKSIAFFPAVLGVLMPKTLLNLESSSKYPNVIKSRAEDGSNNEVYNYEDRWKLELFNIDDVTSRLGILSIDISDIDVIVLDGQHRANAFRVASGAFSDKDSSVYPAFYKDLVPSENLNADLPITLIWFEDHDEDFNPKLVSRRLFVDVNNSAKKVSKSRKILLNDYEIPSLMTRFFYSSIANNNSFELSNFSLFHSEFDKDSDIATSSNNVLAITNPEFLYEILSWLTLGSRKYNDLSYYKSLNYFKNNVFEFSEIFDSPNFNSTDISPDDDSLNNKIVAIKDDRKIETFQKEYLSKLQPVIYSIFANFTLFQPHYKACSQVGVWYDDEMNTTLRTVWEEVFCGGEGLYYTFKSKAIKGKINNTLKSYITGIDEIEKRFKQLRAAYFSSSQESQVNSCYDSANTKAFQVGLFMALDIFKGNESFLEAVEDFINSINTITPDDWVIILNDIKSALIPGVDPKIWPAYQKLILRAIQNTDKIYYHDKNFFDSPDGIIFKNSVSKSFKAWWETKDDISDADLSLETIDLINIHKWGKAAKDDLDRLFSKANLKEIPGISPNDLATSVVKNLIDKYNPTIQR